MTMIKAFEKIFDKSFNAVDSDLFGTDDLLELRKFNNDLYRTELISEIIKFFIKEYDVDLMPMYKDYMNKCERVVINKFSDIMEDSL